MKIFRFSIVILFALLTLIGCEKEEIIESRPYGYGLIHTDYAIRTSFDYRSDKPYQVNQLSLDVFYLPSIWAEIDNSFYDVIPEQHNEFLYLTDAESILRIYPKKILIGSELIEGAITNETVVYQSSDGQPFAAFIASRDQIKWYIDAIESMDVTFIFYDDLIPTTLKSKYQIASLENPFKHTDSTSLLLINWAEEPQAIMDFSSFFPTFHGPSIQQAFLDAYAHASDAEYIKFRQR